MPYHQKANNQSLLVPHNPPRLCLNFSETVFFTSSAELASAPSQTTPHEAAVWYNSFLERDVGACKTCSTLSFHWQTLSTLRNGVVKPICGFTCEPVCTSFVAGRSWRQVLEADTQSRPGSHPTSSFPRNSCGAQDVFLRPEALWLQRIKLASTVICVSHGQTFLEIEIFDTCIRPSRVVTTPSARSQWTRLRLH